MSRSPAMSCNYVRMRKHTHKKLQTQHLEKCLSPTVRISSVAQASRQKKKKKKRKSRREKKKRERETKKSFGWNLNSDTSVYGLRDIELDFRLKNIRQERNRMTEKSIVCAVCTCICVDSNSAYNTRSSSVLLIFSSAATVTLWYYNNVSNRA